MKNVVTLLLLAFTAVGATAQAVNDANAEKRTVSGFHAIRVEGGIDLYLSQGNEEAVAVSANKTEYRDKIKTVVENGVLRIYFDVKSWNFSVRDRKLKAYVSIKTIDGLNASGGSDVTVKGTLNAKSLRLGLSGGSDFEGAVNATDLAIHMSGGSDVDISGKVSKLDIDASGGSDFNGFDLVTDIVNVDASGGSDTEVTANKELTIHASGSSDVHYRGTGVVKKVSTSGGSGVKKI